MTANRSLGIGFAFVCLLILGVMPILAAGRPAGFDGLTFTLWLTFWQLVCAVPLFIRESMAGQRAPKLGAMPPQRRTRTILIALLTSVIFSVSTWMYVVAAEKAGPVSMAIALQSYPLFAILLEAVFLGKRKRPVELALTGVILVALVYLTTNGTFLLSDVSWWSVYALGIPALWAIAHMLLRDVLTTTAVTPNQITVSRLIISGVLLLLVYFVFGESGGLAAGLLDPAFQLSALLLGVAYYAELIFWFHAMRHIDVSVASSIIVPAPALTMVIAVALGSAAIQPHQIVALAVIAAALYGLLLAGRQKLPKPAT